MVVSSAFHALGDGFVGLMTDQAKQRAAAGAVELVEDGMLLGLGSGSTAEYAIHALARRMHAEELRISAVPTSERSGDLAKSLGIPIIGSGDLDLIDLTIDGADEVDASFNMLKGRGGAMFREKLIASASRRVAIVVDSSKLVRELGASPIPIEVPRFGWELVARSIRERGGIGGLRGDPDTPVVTDNGNYIFDARFESPFDPATLEQELRDVPGVIVTGLFIGLLDVLYIGHPNADTEVRHCKRRSQSSR